MMMVTVAGIADDHGILFESDRPVFAISHETGKIPHTFSIRAIIQLPGHLQGIGRTFKVGFFRP